MKNVHSILHELGWADYQGNDPGTGGALPAALIRHYNIVTTTAETRTLANPPRAGLYLLLNMVTDGGDCVITVASAINQSGNTIITLNDAGDCIELLSRKTSSGFGWVVRFNNGASLS